MTVQKTRLKAKICGLTTPDMVKTAVQARADFIGLVFYPPSPRFVMPEAAAALARLVPASTRVVGVFVDPTDAWLEEVLSEVPLDVVQLHGKESPERVEAIAKQYPLPLIKALGIAEMKDLQAAIDYHSLVKWLLFDTKLPPHVHVLPGGTGVSFDWSILQKNERNCQLLEALNGRWFLSGGIRMDNLQEAISVTGASMVDVSSGVESRPGVKDGHKIRQFLQLATGL
ncbi:MAG: phosphoribosylanthranilate isomerase [Alphaproteobacteria bacterium]